MEENIVSSVNAEPVANVEPQTNTQVETTVNEPVNAGSEGVATPQTEKKPAQSAEENAKWAEMRRKAETAEREAVQVKKDYEISKKYGAKWGVHSEQDIATNYAHQGITTIEQFEAAVKRQEYIDQGVDPSLIDKVINENPDVKWAKEMRSKLEQEEARKKDYVSFIEAYPDVKSEEIPAEVWEENAKGKSLVDAYAKYENKMLKQKIAEFEKGKKAAEVNEINAASTTGSVTGQGSVPNGYFTQEQVKAMNQSEVNKNYPQIMESMKHWK